MKKRYTDEQIIAFLKQAEAGTPIWELRREDGFGAADINWMSAASLDKVRVRLFELELCLTLDVPNPLDEYLSRFRDKREMARCL